MSIAVNKEELLSSPSTKSYTGICVGVGGTKGIILTGAIHEFWTRGQLNNLVYYSGSSAGAMISALLSIGYEPIELLTAICAPDFVNQFTELNFMNLPSIYGFYPNSILRKKLERMFILKIGFLPTFNELYNRYHKVLIITNYCLSETDRTKRKIYCSYKTTPDMPVVEAVVNSCIVPLAIQKTVYKGGIYIDGAYTSIFPIKAIQDMAPPACEILGVSMKAEPYDLNSFIGYMMAIHMLPLMEEEQKNMEHVAASTDVLELSSEGSASALDFNISITQKMNMFSSGIRQTRAFLTASPDSRMVPVTINPSKDKTKDKEE